MSNERKYSLLEAKAKLEALCAYQERCSFELEQKMIKWRLDREDIDRLLAHLISTNFLSEERFAEAFVSGKINIKKWGKIKIKQHLKQKRISDYSTKKALNAVDDDLYMSNLHHLAERKYYSLKDPDGYPKKVKIYRFLSAKGYETDLIKDVVEEIFSAQG